MIDWNRVQELRDEVGPDDFKEVVELFLFEVDEVIARLRSGPDATALEEDFHFLRGSALTLGFRDLAELCGRAERQKGTVAPASVIRLYERSRVAFLAELAGICTAA